MPEHDLMESVPPDHHAIPVIPASPPRRDSREDADSSLTRKRPRLDSGSGDNHTMPAVEPDANATSPSNPKVAASEPVEVTINVRSQPHSAAIAASEPNMAKDSTASPAEDDSAVRGSASQIISNQETDIVDVEDSSSNSPTVLAIDDDDDEDGIVNTMSGYPASDFIQLDDTDLLPQEYLQTFPYATEQSPMAAIRMLCNHLYNSPNVEGAVLPSVTDWLEAIPYRTTSQWAVLLLEQTWFWDEFSQLPYKLCMRK